MVRGSSPQPFYSDVFICDYKCTELCDPPLWRGQAGRILAESSCVGRGSGRADRADPQLCGVRTDDRAVPGRGHVLLGHDERALCRLRRRDPGTVPGEPREVEENIGIVGLLYGVGVAAGWAVLLVEHMF